MYSIPIIQACISTIFIAATAAQIGTTNNPHCWQLPAGQYEGDTQCDLGWGNWYKCGGGAEVRKYLPVLSQSPFFALAPTIIPALDEVFTSYLALSVALVS